VPGAQTTEISSTRAASERPTVAVSWTTPFSPPVWEEVLRLHRMELEVLSSEGEGPSPSETADEEAPTVVSLGPALADAHEPRIGRLFVGRASGAEVLLWRLEVGAP
jgi:hypothetical protein